jgi:hypothetical protein
VASLRPSLGALDGLGDDADDSGATGARRCRPSGSRVPLPGTYGRYEMRFLVGLVGGLVAGAAGAVWYSQQTGRDLRAEFDQVRAELKARDFEALGNHLEDRFKELQASVEKSLADAAEKADKAVDEAAAGASDVAGDAADKTSETAKD